MSTRRIPAAQARASTGIPPLRPPELEALLRFGRGMDTGRLVDAGFEYRYTSAGAVQAFARDLRLHRSTGRPPDAYIYEHDVEQFFRHSPSVIRPVDTPDG